MSELEPLGQHPRRPVETPLLSLADVVQQRRNDQVPVLEPPVEQPPRGPRGVNDVARMLGAEEAAQFALEVCLAECKVSCGGFDASIAKLPDPVQH